MKLSFSIAFTKHIYTYRRRNPKKIEGYKRRNHKDKVNTSKSRAVTIFWVEHLENSIKWLQDHLEKVEDSITNNLQLESLKSNFVWRSYGVWNVRKSWEKILDRFHSFLLSFFLLENGREWKYLKGSKRERSHPIRSSHMAIHVWTTCDTRE